jgi:hypothetical protein
MEKNFLLTTFFLNLGKLWMLLLPEEMPPNLLCVPFTWLCWGNVVPPLQHPFDCSYAVVHRGPCSFTIRVGSRDEVISVSCLKACMDADTTPGSPQRQSTRSWRCGQANHRLPRRSSCLQAGLVFRPAGFFTFSSGAARRRSRNHFSPTLRGGFCMP